MSCTDECFWRGAGGSGQTAPVATHMAGVVAGMAKREGCRVSGSQAHRCDERPHQLALVESDTPEGHREHDHEAESHAHLHLGQPADVVSFKAEQDVDAGVDPFDPCPAIVDMFPDEGVPGDGGEDASVNVERHSNGTAE